MRSCRCRKASSSTPTRLVELFAVEDGLVGQPVMDLFEESTHSALKGALAACLQGAGHHSLKANACPQAARAFRSNVASRLASTTVSERTARRSVKPRDDRNWLRSSRKSTLDGRPGCSIAVADRGADTAARGPSPGHALRRPDQTRQVRHAGARRRITASEEILPVREAAEGKHCIRKRSWTLRG